MQTFCRKNTKVRENLGGRRRRVFEDGMSCGAVGKRLAVVVWPVFSDVGMLFSYLRLCGHLASRPSVVL